MSIWETISKNAEMITASSAILIAASSLIVSFWQGLVIRKHNRKSVVPYVSFRSYNSKNEFSIFIKNNGIGPAVIQSMMLDYKNAVNELTRESFLTVLVDLFPSIIIDESQLNTFKKNLFLPAGEEYNFLTLVYESSEEFINVKDEFNIIINYNSIYGERFVAMLHRN